MITAFFSSREGFESQTAELEPMRRVVEKFLSEQDSLTGYCAACGAISVFRIVRPSETGGWKSLRESIVCADCGLNGRQRMALSLVRGVYRDLKPGRAHVFERITPFYATLEKHGFPIAGSEYIDADAQSGSRHTHSGIEIVHQDMCATSYASNELDFVCHFDVLEHVPDYYRALGECARILRPGGLLLFTVPFFGAAETQIRSEIIDGALVHHEPPAYHENPVSAERSSLVFFLPGWTILSDLRRLGFETAEIGLCYDAFQGIVGDNNPFPDWLMWPVFFRAVKA